MSLQIKRSLPRELVFLNPVGGVSLGGGEMVAVEVLVALALRGWRILLLTPADSGLLKDHRLEGKVEFITLALDRGGRRSFEIVNVIRTIVTLSREHPDALWYGNTYRALKWLALAKVAGDVRTVCHLHESFYGPYYYWRTRLMARFIDSFICISDAVRREISQGTRRANLPAVTIYNGLPPTGASPKTAAQKQRLREELGLPVTNPLVCMAARSDPLKGHEVFLQAAAKVAESNRQVRFLVIGGDWDGPCQNELEGHIKQRRKELGLSEALMLLPHTARVRDYMRCADVVVVPSLSEGFGRVAVEAMMEETAVIASNVGGLAEILRDNQDGILVQPGNEGELARGIQKMLADAEFRERGVASAHARSQALFSHEAMIEQIERHLATIQP
jgi:glycosyltransferase involved in cell wall biosynthesis